MAASKKIAGDAVAPSLLLATPDYWAEACKHLVKKDRVMKRLIPQFGDAALQTKGDPFITPVSYTHLTLPTTPYV